VPACTVEFRPRPRRSRLEEFQNWTVADLLKQERLDELDCTADQLPPSKARFAGGIWQMQALYRGLEDPWVGHATEIDGQNHIEPLKRWVKTKPQSITARIALAEAYGNYDWDARGTGTSDTVSETGWDLFHEGLEKAKKTLDEAATLDAKCPEWYVAMETVARGQGRDVPHANPLIEKAIEFEPAYYSSYGMHAIFLIHRGMATKGTLRNSPSRLLIASAAKTATSFISKLPCVLLVLATSPSMTANPERSRENRGAVRRVSDQSE